MTISATAAELSLIPLKDEQAKAENSGLAWERQQPSCGVEAHRLQLAILNERRHHHHPTSGTQCGGAKPVPLTSAKNMHKGLAVTRVEVVRLEVRLLPEEANGSSWHARKSSNGTLLRDSSF